MYDKWTNIERSVHVNCNDTVGQIRPSYEYEKIVT